MKRAACQIILAITLASTAASAAPKALQFTGRGTQIYRCTVSASGYAWVLRGPDAHMYDASGKAVARHYFGPRWQANDGSTIKGTVVDANASPQAGHHNAAWLVLRAIVERGNGIFGQVNRVTRTNTEGGGTPMAACDATDKGRTEAVPYTATYTFFSSGTNAASGK